jgi:murein peptide amidase A
VSRRSSPLAGASPALGLAIALAALALAEGLARPATAGSRQGAHTRTRVFGHSVEGRALQVKRSGARDAAGEMLVVGEIHGDETAGRAIVRKLRRPGSAPANVELWTVLEMNPDGAAHDTRQNAHGVDLNRNFSRGWRPRGRPGSTYYSGPSPASEPETRAAIRLIGRIRPDATVWYHQHLDLVDASRGANRHLVKRYAEVAGMRVERLPRYPGTATRWENGRWRRHNAFVVELPGGSLSSGAVRRHVRAVRAVGRKVARR